MKNILFLILCIAPFFIKSQELDIRKKDKKIGDFDIKFYSSSGVGTNYCVTGDGSNADDKKAKDRVDYDKDPNWARSVRFSTVISPLIALTTGGDHSGTLLYLYSETTKGLDFLQSPDEYVNLIWKWDNTLQKIQLGFYGVSFRREDNLILNYKSYTHYFESINAGNGFNSEFILARNALIAIINSNGVMIKRKDFVSHEKNIYGNYADEETYIITKGTHDGYCFASWEDDSYLRVDVSNIYTDNGFTNWYDGTCNKLIFDSYFYDDEDITIKASETITMSLEESDGNRPVEVQDGSSLILKAGEKIVLKPGFHAAAGSYFRASIDNTIQCESFKFEDKNGLVVNNEDELMQIETESFDSENKLSTKSFTDNLSLFTVYPNPTRGELTVTLPEGSYNLQLTDVTGKLVADFGSNKQSTQTLDISHLENGMYFLKIYNHDTQHIERVVVQK